MEAAVVAEAANNIVLLDTATAILMVIAVRAVLLIRVVALAILIRAAEDVLVIKRLAINGENMNRVNATVQGFKHFQKMGANYSPRVPGETTEALPPGIYGIKADQEGNLYFIPQSTITDDLIRTPNTTSDKIIKEVKHFWNATTKSKFDKYGLIYKRGILLHGKQGTGKTCTIVQTMEDLVADGGIVIFNPEPNLLFHGINRMREIQPMMKVLVVFEEFENMCNNSDFKSLLDGELQIDNIVYIATTNYIDRVPATFKNRPSRFATVLELGAPSAAERLAYLTAKLHADDKHNLDEWVEISKGMVIDQIKDLIVSVCCYDLTLIQAASKIEKMDFNDPSNTNEEENEEEVSYEEPENNGYGGELNKLKEAIAHSFTFKVSKG